MRKSLLVACLTVMLGLGTVALGDDGIPSSERLARLGLASLDTVSDSAGQAVRGRAFGAMHVNFHNLLAPPPIFPALDGRLVFGTDGNPLGTIHDARLGTAYPTIDPVTGDTILINVPFDASATTAVNGVVSVSTYSFQGNLFARGN